MGLTVAVLMLSGALLTIEPTLARTAGQVAGPSIDGTAHNAVNLAPSLSVTLTSTKSQDVIVVLVGINTAGGAASVQSVTSPHLTFSHRATGMGSPTYLEEWYSVASSVLSSEVITVTLTGSSRFTVMALAVSGANTATIFDGNPSIGPGGCCGSVGGSPYGTLHATDPFSTNNPSDLVIAYDASTGNPTYVGNSPLTLRDQTTVSSWMASAWGDAVVTTPQTSQQYSFTTSIGENGIVFVDAIMQGASTTSSSTSSSSTSSSSTSRSSSSSTSSTTSSSSSSSSSTTSSSSSSTTALQAGSNKNYFIMDNGAYLHNVTVGTLLTGQLSGTSAGTYGGNWSLQLNAYSPNGYAAAYTQYVISYSGGVMAPDAESYSSTGVFLGEDALPAASIPSGALTAGTQVSITALTDSTGNVVGVEFSVVANNGQILWTESSSLTGYPYLEAPIVGFEIILVGYGGGSQSIATFTQADGVFLYSSSTPLEWTTTFPGNFSWVQYKAGGSSESSNTVYWIPQQETPYVIGQSFGI